jgi:hypothetical protein
MESPIVTAIKIVFAADPSRETAQKVAAEYRDITRTWLERWPDFAEVNRQVEEIFKQHGV